MKPARTVWSRSFFPVLLTYFIDNFGQAIVYPIFTPLFLKPDLHLLGTSFSFFHRTLLLGFLIASFPLAQLFGAPLLGEWSDRIGRKRVFLITITGSVFGYFLTGLGIHMRDLPLLWIGRALAGFFAGNLTLCLACIADITHSKEERSRNFGWIGTLAGLGFVLAILTGGSLSNPDLEPFFSPQIPFFLTSFLSLANLGLIYVYFIESKRKEPHDKLDFIQSIKNIGAAFFTKGIRWIYLIYLLFIISWVTSLQFFSAYLIHDFHVVQNTITYAFIFIGVAWSFANFILNPILTRFLSPKAIFLIGLCVLSTFLFFTLIPHQPLYLFLLHFFIASSAAALSWTNGLATLSSSVGRQVQGSILGVNQSIVALGFIVGPVLGGVIAGVDIHKLYVFTALSALIAALLLFKRFFEIKKT